MLQTIIYFLPCQVGLRLVAITPKVFFSWRKEQLKTSMVPAGIALYYTVRHSLL